MRVAYEDVRFKPQGTLATELISCSLEEELAKPMATQEESTNATLATYATATLAADEPPPHPPAPTSATNMQQSLLATPQNNSTTQSHANTDRPERGERDIGIYASNIRNDSSDIHGAELQRDTSRELNNIYEIVGSKQMTAAQLAFAPPFVLHEALKQEHESNWTDAYEEVSEREVPRDSNIITSHVVYKIKTDEEGRRKLKARIVPHGNHDNEKDCIRKDSSNAPLLVFRLLLSLVTFLGLRIGTADIKGAFLQSGPITRQIFVRPPREWPGLRGLLWKLLKLPYGIADAGRQWQKAVESWMLEIAGMERVFGLSPTVPQTQLTR